MPNVGKAVGRPLLAIVLFCHLDRAHRPFLDLTFYKANCNCGLSSEDKKNPADFGDNCVVKVYFQVLLPE